MEDQLIRVPVLYRCGKCGNVIQYTVWLRAEIKEGENVQCSKKQP